MHSLLAHEVKRRNPLFENGTLLTPRETQKLREGRPPRTPYDLPERGQLIPSLITLAYEMQERRPGEEKGLVVIDYDDALDLIPANGQSTDVIRAGCAMNVLDELDDHIRYYHQLVQEFFAARQLAKLPQPDLVRVAWHVDHVSPTLAETLERISDSDPLPPLAGTGWEETTVLAAAMSPDPDSFVRDLLDANLPLAARCAAAPDVSVSDTLCDTIRGALITRTLNPAADLRARIAAGLALGEIGDPRFERRTGPFGDYLLPPMIPIDGGAYTMGRDDGLYNREEPVHTVTLELFEMGQFPVTNAEYALFIEAGGYEDERWWDTDAAQAWRRGEGANEGPKQQWRESKKTLEGWSEDHIRNLVTQNRITSKQAEAYRWAASCDDEEFEEALDEQYPTGRQTEPAYWDNDAYNNPSQPVVGICWYEARAYCAWLSAQTLTPAPSPTRGEEHGERWEVTPELAAKMTEIARRLRRESTPSEDILWQALRNRQLAGRKFRRQEAVGPFVLDFYCPQERLAVEVDGAVHNLPEQQAADAERQALIETLGIRFVRLSADLVEQHLPVALDHIRAAFLPSPGVGEGSGVRVFRLPTEAEWEAAARGQEARRYPYGSEFDVALSNTFESHLRRTTPIGVFPGGETLTSLIDMSGNVYDWTSTIYRDYPYQSDDGREDATSVDETARRVVRGGSWDGSQFNARGASRRRNLPSYRHCSLGFRVVRVPHL